MKKVWTINVSDKLPIETQRQIKRLLHPSRLGILQPQKCLFCPELTTWAINGKPVCPKCAVQYNFLTELWLLDPCEVCGKQGEWATDSRNEPQHFLCYHHRNEWFHWTIPELESIDYEKESKKWQQAWNEGWARFIKHQKALCD